MFYVLCRGFKKILFDVFYIKNRFICHKKNLSLDTDSDWIRIH